MSICMIVHNNGTRDGRVMREAHTLQSAGYQVTVVGIPEAGVSAREEILPDGIRILRVPVDSSRLHRLLQGSPRLLLFAIFAAALGYAGVAFTRGAVALAASRLYQFSGKSSAAALLAACATILLGVGYCSARIIRGRSKTRLAADDAMRRAVIAVGAQADPHRPFPAIRSRIPRQLPDWLLEVLMEPFSWLGAPKFALYRWRSKKLAAAAIRLKPDIVHCHDCVALPTGFAVKQSLAIPLVYDAHEIYEAVAARKLGATDYFARIHEKYLPQVDGFIAVNDSAALYYARAYPAAPAAVVIRNATDRVVAGSYDGRLHRAAQLLPSQKILLYQGGFTKHRGLDILVRSAELLPPDWSLVMMGAGPLLNHLRTVAGQLSNGHPPRICFLPAVHPDELLSWTQGATVGIVPYEDVVLNHWIATPNKLWEYPNAGVPMIVQPFPEMRRIVETYGCGWVLPESFSAASIANLVASLTDDDIRAAREGCGRFIARDNWTRSYRPRLLELYKALRRKLHEAHFA